MYEADVSCDPVGTVHGTRSRPARAVRSVVDEMGKERFARDAIDFARFSVNDGAGDSGVSIDVDDGPRTSAARLVDGGVAASDPVAARVDAGGR